ncbi:SPOR domain-containing protein [Asticcacaulis sp. EMRT-3]|uniref:SPOR domain-containing protein n=1 Tax=Asticcacaulis sp. EMRT-3 TaxID=3040349 RepID=UPI0024AECA22|nr:SPOR domain-containing protein [Asticcacaulis sp. EMRT-3]MDI7775032.1 SPOR domain-containing protein [Asticcacaulis sp. EMRT-3]
MTDLAHLRKVGIVCAAASLALGLNGCDNSNLRKTFADLKAVQVDDSGQPAQKRLTKNDVRLLVSTAKAMTVGQGGLFKPQAAEPNKVTFAVVDPLKMPPPDDGGPLRVLPADTVARARLQAARDLPDLPILQAAAQTATQAVAQAATQAVVQSVMPSGTSGRTMLAAKAPVAPSPAASAESNRLIQVGSFSSVQAARTAWDHLQTQYPVALRYKARFQPITTASGQAMVRLKVGPVADGAHAEALCQALSVRDSWCERAG